MRIVAAFRVRDALYLESLPRDHSVGVLASICSHEDKVRSLSEGAARHADLTHIAKYLSPGVVVTRENDVAPFSRVGAVAVMAGSIIDGLPSAVPGPIFDCYLPAHFHNRHIEPQFRDDELTGARV